MGSGGPAGDTPFAVSVRIESVTRGPWRVQVQAEPLGVRREREGDHTFERDMASGAHAGRGARTVASPRRGRRTRNNARSNPGGARVASHGLVAEGGSGGPAALPLDPPSDGAPNSVKAVVENNLPAVEKSEDTGGTP